VFAYSVPGAAPESMRTPPHQTRLRLLRFLRVLRASAVAGAPPQPDSAFGFLRASSACSAPPR